MRSFGYKACPDCGAGLRDGRKQFCGPCGDKRREERETKYRKARQATKEKSMAKKLGDQPIQPEFYERMNQLAGILDEAFNGVKKGKARPTGFVLLVYPFNNLANGDARCNFISNGADRKDLVVLFKEMIARFEGQPEQKGTA